MNGFRVREDKTLPSPQRVENFTRKQGSSRVFPSHGPSSSIGAHALLEKHQDVPLHAGIFTNYLEEFLVVCTKRSDKRFILYHIQQNFWLSLSALEGVLQMTKAPKNSSSASGKESDKQQGGDEDKDYG